MGKKLVMLIVALALLAVGIFAGRQFGTDNFSRRREDVGQAQHLVAGRTCLHFVGPTDDEGRAMAAFPLVALHAPPGASPVVLVVASHRLDGRHFRPVVRGPPQEKEKTESNDCNESLIMNGGRGNF